jgi:hypothetical protein
MKRSNIMKHKGKIIAGALIILVLAVAWFWGGNYARSTAPTSEAPVRVDAAPLPDAMEPEPKQPEAVAQTDITPLPDAEVADSDQAEETEQPSANTPPSISAEVLSPLPDTDKVSTEPKTGSPKQEIDPETRKDKYQTDPVPEGKPLPVEPQDTTAGDQAYAATLSVKCDTILSNIDSLRSNKVELVPDDGVIFPATTVTYYEGESVFNLLQREMRRAKIHLAFRNTPIYNSAYIEAINNLYEFDCGELSGWMYKVNGWFPNYGCSRYQLKQGDLIEWVYTCDLGRDVGGGYAAGNK